MTRYGMNPIRVTLAFLYIAMMLFLRLFAANVAENSAQEQHVGLDAPGIDAQVTQAVDGK